MNTLLMLVALASSPLPVPEDVGPVADVDTFIAEREVCEHFIGEPTEGSSPEQVERRNFVRDSIEIHCAGTDRRLAALRRRFADYPAVIARLAPFETSIEAGCEQP
jgi:hypothetical protein